VPDGAQIRRTFSPDTAIREVKSVLGGVLLRRNLKILLDGAEPDDDMTLAESLDGQQPSDVVFRIRF
jgi:hypothetical protein